MAIVAFFINSLIYGLVSFSVFNLFNFDYRDLYPSKFCCYLSFVAVSMIVQFYRIFHG